MMSEGSEVQRGGGLASNHLATNDSSRLPAGVLNHSTVCFN